MATAYVYLAQLEPPVGPIKIGATRNLRERLEALGQSLPGPLHLLGFIRFTGRKGGANAWRVEHELHQLFQGCRRYGEWFDACEAMVSFIEKETEKRPLRICHPQYDYLMTATEMSARLGVRPAVIRKLSREREIPCFEIGSRRRYDLRLVADALSDRESDRVLRLQSTPDITGARFYRYAEPTNIPRPDASEMIGRKEMAALIGITPQLLGSLADKGLIPSHRTGTKQYQRRYCREQVYAAAERLLLKGHLPPSTRIPIPASRRI